MRRKIILSFTFFFITISLAAQFKIRLELESLPVNTPPGSVLFIAGSFNNWNPQHKNYQFQNNEKGYFLELSLAPGKYEFKITRGGWDKVESNNEGMDTGNRGLIVDSDGTMALNIAGWKDMFSVQVKKTTANRNVRILDTAFFIPQLNRFRRVWIYLPPAYYSSTKKYPVLYMHDGQNVFDDATSFSGEWGVDEALDTLGLKINECIVVAVDNGGARRLNEYCPYDFDLKGIAANYPSGKGEGQTMLTF
jgi:hypothetical protein